MKRVSFYPQRQPSVTVVLTSDEIDLPSEVSAVSGICKYIVSGYADGKLYITLEAEIEIAETSTPSVTPAGSPTPSEIEQIYALINNATHAPYIKDGKWYYWDADKQQYVEGGNATGENGQNGTTPHIGVNGHWYLGDTDTGITAAGTDGSDGITPHIGDNNNWYIGDYDTNIKAIAEDGEDGVSPQIIVTNIIGGHKVTVVDAECENDFDVIDGVNGINGTSPTVTITDVTGGHKISITDIDGTHDVIVLNGTNGTNGSDFQILGYYDTLAALQAYRNSTYGGYGLRRGYCRTIRHLCL